jgi:hypothetical protein
LNFHLPDRGPRNANSGFAGHRVAQGKPVHQDQHLVLPASADVAGAADSGQSGQYVQESAHGHPVEAVLGHAHRASGDILLNGRGFGFHFDRIHENRRGIEGCAVEPRPQVGPHDHAGDAQNTVSHDAEADAHGARGHVENEETAGCVGDRAQRGFLHQHIDARQRNARFRVPDRALENAGGACSRLALDEQEKKQDESRPPNKGTPGLGPWNGISRECSIEHSHV